ncbi:hypothetical protein M501DRAFT_1019400 [Patellaria atrata CBS 101060]|uniref:Uncharacterized protein n=1 Tax=Patellaria atrata CBS 101060 TaxID=1346257 RepID=A0A9P4S5Y4_9PEZI|nr:hypothetical protein M501DRAFT_1019400 [Patellaria atrata CBS 101060]
MGSSDDRTSDRVTDSEDELFDPAANEDYLPDHHSPETAQTEDEAWRPLAHFMLQLTGLTDLDSPEEVDLYDFALASSPCLYRIYATVYEWDSHGKVNYNREAIERMVTGLAPQLKSINICHTPPRESPELTAAERQPRPTWRGFGFDESQITKQQGKLHTLNLGVAGVTTASTFLAWSHITAFSGLRVLKIQTLISLDMLRCATDLQF